MKIYPKRLITANLTSIIITLIITLSIGLNFFLWSPKVYAKSESSNNQVISHTLDNGLKVIIQQNPRAPVAAIYLTVKVGSSYESLGITGISHMLEHMLFKSTEDYPNQTYSDVIAETGGTYNAFTTFDYTTYHSVVESSQIEKVLSLESSRLTSLIFDPDVFIKERSVVTEERKLTVEDRPWSVFNEQMRHAAFANNPYQHPIIGWASDIQQYTLEDVIQWYRQWYVPNNIILTIVGDINPEVGFVWAQKYFGHLKAKSLPTQKRHPTITGFGQRTVDVYHPQVTNPSLALMYNTPVINTALITEESYALTLLATILGGTPSSILQSELLRNQAVASHVSAYYSGLSRLDSIFSINLTPQPGTDLDTVKQAVFEIIDDIKTNALDKEILDKAKTAFRASFIYSQDSLSYQARFYSGLEAVGLSYELKDRYLDQINQITPEDIQRVAIKYLDESRLIEGRLYPEDTSIKSSTNQL